MSFTSIAYPDEKSARYTLLLEQTRALTDGVSHPIANLANVAALLYQALPDINWCGFYLMDKGALMLGPFCGLPACIRIPLGRGVCGTAAKSDEIQRVYDVHQFPGHIACDSASNSEIVIPLHFGGSVIGVLDIDSPTIGRFDETDQENLLSIVKHLERCCCFEHTLYTLD
ncbi:MAG: GAF domain-containing protein [Clostridia bacterium]|nr:GAF domain-containing protein [Clostridia bacterium]